MFAKGCRNDRRENACANSVFFEKLKTAPDNRKTAPEKLQNEGYRKLFLASERKSLFLSPAFWFHKHGLKTFPTPSHLLVEVIT